MHLSTKKQANHSLVATSYANTCVKVIIPEYKSSGEKSNHIILITHLVLHCYPNMK